MGGGVYGGGGVYRRGGVYGGGGDLGASPNRTPGAAWAPGWPPWAPRGADMRSLCPKRPQQLLKYMASEKGLYSNTRERTEGRDNRRESQVQRMRGQGRR